MDNQILWWGKTISGALIALFFLFVGLNTFLASYLLKNPLEFIMSFFSSSLMILISLVAAFYSGNRIYSKCFSDKKELHD